MKNLSRFQLPSRFSSSRAFEEIPSPPAIPVLGHSHLFLKNGPYSKERLTEAVLDLSLKYGSIFRIRILGKEFVVTTNAENAGKVFQFEGKYPMRMPMPALAQYHQETFGTIGVVPGNGETWYKLRKALVPLLQKSYILCFKEKLDEIAEDFIGYIRKHRNDELILSDVYSDSVKYTVECISVVSSGVRVRCLEDDATACKLLNASCNFMDGLYRTLSEPPVWKYIKTKGYREMETGLDVIKKFVDEQLSRPVISWNYSFMKTVSGNRILTENETRLLTTEVFLGGIDAMATAITMTLYYLSKNPRHQSLAFSELSDNSQNYLKACLKETLRLSATSGAVSRILPVDVVMNEYHIPAKTNIMVYHSVSSLMEKYFENANAFEPERWLSDKYSKKDEFTAFASLPFGHGARVCPGRWLSEQECLSVLTKIIEVFELQCCNETEVGMVYRMNRIPDRPVKIRFTDRT